MNYNHGLLSFKFASFATAEFKHSFKVLDGQHQILVVIIAS